VSFGQLHCMSLIPSYAFHKLIPSLRCQRSRLQENTNTSNLGECRWC